MYEGPDPKSSVSYRLLTCIA